jgi:hypothetical protein
LFFANSRKNWKVSLPKAGLVGATSSPQEKQGLSDYTISIALQLHYSSLAPFVAFSGASADLWN